MADYTHYEILAVTPAATAKEIKAAYQRAVRVAHPDAGGTAAMFGMVRSAYETLSDPSARAAYDAQLLRGDDEPPFSDHQPPPRSGTPRNSYSRRPTATPEPPEPEWGEDVDWRDAARAHIDDWNSVEVADDEPGWGTPVRNARPDNDHAPTYTYRSVPRGRFEIWARSSAGFKGLVATIAVIVALYALFASILFANAQAIRPGAATSDLAEWAFVDGPFLRIIVIVYTVALIGSYFGSAPYLLGGHAIGAIALLAWALVYWDIATAGERVRFLGFGLLWVVYTGALALLPLLLGMRARPDHAR